MASKMCIHKVMNNILVAYCIQVPLHGEIKAKFKQCIRKFWKVLKKKQEVTELEIKISREYWIKNLLTELDEELQWFGHAKQTDRRRIPRTVEQKFMWKRSWDSVEQDDRAKCAGIAVTLDSYLGDAHYEYQAEQQPSWPRSSVVFINASRHMLG
jgi:tRNA U55 pseudouridine synthase TruB